MYKVIFYDRKHQREISHGELMPINFVRTSVVVEEESDAKKRWSILFS